MSAGGVVRLGRAELPPAEQRALARAVRLEWLTIAFLVCAVTLVYLVMGSSQALRTAWVEDLLSFIPPFAFLAAVRMTRKPPSARHPYGFHRSVGIGHLVAATALLTMGSVLVLESLGGLLRAEHVPVGTVVLLGQEVWAGWPMVGAMVLTGVPPVLLGRAKLPLAERLHDRVLHADADMNKADWMTAAGGIVGVLGLGVGLWWLDGVAALFISGSILRDGVTNLRVAVTALMDARALTVDGSRPHPLDRRVDEALRALPWVAEAESRVRDLGHVFHVEAFVVAADGRAPTLPQLEEARRTVAALDWTLQDVVVVPVAQLPRDVLPQLDQPGERASGAG